MISVFSTDWFKKYNRQITWIAKLPLIGEWIFCFKKFGHYIDRNRIVEVTPNSVIEFVKMRGKKKVELRQHFFVRNEYALRLQKVFYPIWITFHIWDIITRPIPQLNLGFDTLTVYPDDGNPGTDSCDAFIRNIDSNWTTCRNSTSGTVYNNNGLDLARSAFFDPNYYITRGFESFKTSSLSGTTISSAVLSNYGQSHNGNFVFYLVQSSQANANAVVSNDFNDIGSTSFGTYSYTNWTDSDYNDLTLNASGLAAINKDGITKFAFREEHDFNNSAPASNFYATIISSGYGTNIPKLVITYSTVSGPANLKTYNTNATANIKTINTNAIANVKSLNTNV